MKPGDRQQADNRAHKDATGSSPNGVANKWLAERRSRFVTVLYRGEEIVRGHLLAFDSYSLLVKGHDSGMGLEPEVLVFKGPGVVVYGGG